MHIFKQAKIPRGIWALGLVSMFMDMSSEMIHALLPIYMVSVLGASTLSVGFIEGIAEATASITKIFSGTLSDWLGKRKFLAAFGYGMAALTKPIFPLASSLEWLIAARFIDRVGKGIRGAPRDALVADIAPPELRGASFGLRQSLDTIGAFTGPLLAIGLMVIFAGNYKLVFWVAVIPAVVSFLVLVFAVTEPKAREARPVKSPLHWSDITRLPLGFWVVTAVASLLTLARFSEAFLVLRAREIGLPVALAPAVMVVMNLVYALTAYPAGALSDRIGRRSLLLLGIGFLVVSDIVLGLAQNNSIVILGVIFWGLHMGFTQGLFATIVADTSPADLRGSAFGIFNLIGGIAMLLASVVAGWLWQSFGAQMTFYCGALLTALALLGFSLLPNLLKKPSVS